MYHARGTAHVICVEFVEYQENKPYLLSDRACTIFTSKSRGGGRGLIRMSRTASRLDLDPSRVVVLTLKFIHNFDCLLIGLFPL